MLQTFGMKSMSEETPPIGIKSWFMVALAVRKFQKFESNKYKKSLRHYFDKNAAVEEINGTLHFDKDFFVKLVYLIRKFKLTFQDLTNSKQIVAFFNDCLKQKNQKMLDQTMLNFLCMALKFLTKNSSDNLGLLDMSFIVSVLKEGLLENHVRITLLSLIMTYFEKMNIEEKLLKDILDLDDLGADARSFFLSMSNNTKSLDEQEGERKFSMGITKVKKNRLAVTKNVQSVKSRENTQTSEESDFQMINLADSFKNRNRNRACNIIEDLPDPKSKEGDDRSMFRNTWKETINLYTLIVSQKNVLKDDDKDNYLPSKLFGQHYYNSSIISERKVYSFFINRMCTAIFCDISRSQRLNMDAIDKLMNCIQSFDKVVSLLNLGEDFEKNFVTVTYYDYWNIKELDAPDFAVTLLTEMRNQTTEEYDDKYWFKTFRRVRQKSYDEAQVQKVVIKDVNKLRSDAAKAIYNAALRDKKSILTQTRLSKIMACYKFQGKDCHHDKTFTDTVNKLLELAETLDDFDYKEMFQFYMDCLKKDDEEKLETIIRFLTNQARDLKRSKELFSQDSLEIIIDWLSKNLEEKQKLKLLEIINILMQHEMTKVLSEANLSNILENCLKSSTKLRNAALTSLLLTTDKSQRITANILKLLMKKLASETDEDYTSFIIFILSRVFCINDASIQSSDYIELVSTKLFCNHLVLLNSEDDGAERVKFEPQPSNDQTGHKISFLALKMIWNSVESKIILSPKTIDNVLIMVSTAGDSEQDKQSKIVAAKCLYGITKYMSFPSPNYLNQLFGLIDNSIYDVGVYIQSAYMRECAKVAFAPTPNHLDDFHLKNISSLFVMDGLKLGKKDFGEEINKCFFQTLLYESQKHREFEDQNIFHLFNHILTSNQKHVAEVLSILLVYTLKHLVPQITVRSLEELLAISDYFEKALQVLKNIILCGKLTVTSKTLSVFSEYLHKSNNKRRRFYSFKLLNQASQNQELPENVFDQLELTKAAFALETIERHRDDKQSIFQFVEELVEKGLPLSIDVREALEVDLGSAGALKILSLASRNRQMIPQNLMKNLVEMFNPEEENSFNSIHFLTIFENMAKNNQKLPTELMKKLERALELQKLEKTALDIFIFLAQKGEVLSKSVIERLLSKLQTEDGLILKQELLSSLGSLIQANKDSIQPYQSKIFEILSKQLLSDNHNVSRLCVIATQKLVKVFDYLDEDLLNKLVQVGTDPNTNKDIKYEIKVLFETLPHDSIAISEKKQKIQLANLSLISPREILHQLHSYTCLEGGLLPQNYHQLKEILDNEGKELQEEVLILLKKCTFKGSLTDELLDSLAVLYLSTTSSTLQQSCLLLLSNSVDHGKILSGRAKEIYTISQSHEKSVLTFLDSDVGKEIMQDFGHDTAVNLIELVKDKKKLSIVRTFPDFIHLVVAENPDFPKEKHIVLLLENCLLKGVCPEIALPCYCRVIKQISDCRTECLEAVIKFQQDLGSLEQYRVLFEAMFYTIKFTDLPDTCISVVLQNIDCQDRVIRSYSFGIFRALSKKKSYERLFLDYCDQLRWNLKSNWQIDLPASKDYLDLLEVAVSVAFLDVEVFKTKERSVWKREIIISDIFEHFKVSYVEQVHFYKSWFEIEKKLGYHKSCKILSLIQKCEFGLFEEVLELSQILLDFEFNQLQHSLMIYIPNPFMNMKQEWSMVKIQKCLSKKGINLNYSWQLAEKLCKQLSVKFIKILFGSLQDIDNIRAFESLIDFCTEEEIDLTSILTKSESILQLDDLRNAIEVRQACKHSKNPLGVSKIEEKTFAQVYKQLKLNKWSFNQLRNLIQSFKHQFSNLLLLFNTLLMYQVPPSQFEEIKTMFDSTMTFCEIILMVNKVAIENRFQREGKEKDLKELVDEIGKSNMDSAKWHQYQNTLDVKKHILEGQAEKLNWTHKQIQVWAKTVKEKGFNDYEAIAVIYQANFLITGHRLTYTQMLCCIVALSENTEIQKRGKLLQVATGEGKSTIICILAIIKALRGQKVDVITSSPILAERDAQQKAQLYRMFGLTVSDNRDKTVYLKGEKDCYKKDVVYGEMSQFQFDILRDRYSKLDTLGGREFKTAIIDEVDSMLIDDSSKIARLSSTVPGMDHFQPIYVYIWQYLTSVKERFIMFNNKMYFVEGKVGFEKGKITLEVLIDDKGTIGKIPDLEAHIKAEGDKSDFVEAIKNDLDDFLIKKVELYLDHQLKNNQIYIPCNFTEFVSMQRVKWITNAVEALNYEENVHYVIHDGEIKPVDYHSTGIVQSSTSWSDGLHQFLQLKHNLKMTCETLTTNFLSNMGFMSKYEKIYGLTGTLGSETARNVLKDVYKVDLINIPQRREKQFMELCSIIKESEQEWLDEILKNVLLEIQKDRGILLICQTIQQANHLSGLLKAKLRPSSVKLYVRNDLDQERNVEKILPGEVIIATNLAGRGTDIQTHEIEETGGLHVIVTFLPSNQRVEDQAFGRTARQGKRGTGLLILNSCEGVKTTHEVKALRDKSESHQLTEFTKKELKLIQTKDELFDIFCNFMNDEIRATIRDKHYSFFSFNSSPSTEETSILAAVEEQWAGFLAKLDEGQISCQEGNTKCKELIVKIREEFQGGNVIKNPYYYITWANDILISDQSAFFGSSTNQVELALKYFKKAIQLEDDHLKKVESEKGSKESDKNQDQESNHPGAAHVGVAWCTALLKSNENYKDDTLNSLKAGLRCVSNEMSIINSIQMLLKERQANFVNSMLEKQLGIKVNILGSYLRGIDGSIDAIKRSKRLIDITSIKRETGYGFGNQLKREIRKHFKDQERKQNSGTFQNQDLKISSKNTYSMTFNHLTKRDDSGTKDQALDTLNNAFDENCLTSDSSSVRVLLNQVDLDNMRSLLFNSNKEFIDLTRESALAKLQEERSFWHTMRVGSSHQTKMTIHKNNQHYDYHDKQINELISLVEDQEVSDNTLRFDLIFKDANINKINKHFGLGQRSGNMSLEITFQNLNKENAKSQIDSIKAESLDLEFVLHKSALLKIMDSNQKTINYAVLYNSESQHFEKIKIEQIVEHVEKLKTDETPCFMRFEKLTKEQGKSIVESCSDMTSFTICFKGINDYHGSPKLTESQTVDLCFDQLNQSSAQAVINTLRDYNLEFSLEFVDLTKQNLEFILKHANLEQEHIEVTKKPKKIVDLFMKNSIPTYELNEFTSKGIEFIIQMNEKLFIPWRSVCIVSGLAFGQVLLGGILMCTGFGTSLGMGIVTEGLSDALTAYKAYSSRQFRWSDYCTQKAISLTITAVSMGFSKIKDAAKGVKSVTTGVAKGALEQSGGQIISQGQTIAQTMQVSGANLNSLTWKYIGVKATETAAREMLNQGIQALSNYSFDHLKPKICQSVQSNVWRSFSNPNLKCLLFKMQAIDSVTRSMQLQSKIEQIVSEILKTDTMTQYWNSVGLPLIKGILSDPQYYGSTASMVFRVGGILNGLKQVVTMTDTVTEGILNKLILLDRNSLTITLILHTNLKIDRETSEIISKKLRTHGIFDQSDQFTDDADEKIDLLITTDLDDHMINSIRFVKEIYGNFATFELDSLSQIMKNVSDKITDQLVQVMDSQMLQPLSTLLVSKVVDSVSAQIQNYCLVNKDQNSPSQKEDEKKFEELSKKDKDDLTPEEAKFISNFSRFMTFADQINSNSKDFCIAYSQCEMAYYAKQTSTGQRNDSNESEVKEMSEKIQQGGPANIATMIATAEKNGINLKIVDNINYELTPDDIANNVKVVYVEYGSDNGIGHVQYLDNDTKQFVDTNSTGNDCFFAAFSKILEKEGITKSVSELRTETAQQINANANDFSQVFQAQEWIRSHHPDNSNAILMTVGLHKNLKTGELELDNGDDSALVNDIQNNRVKRGGSKQQKPYKVS